MEKSFENITIVSTETILVWVYSNNITYPQVNTIVLVIYVTDRWLSVLFIYLSFVNLSPPIGELLHRFMYLIVSFTMSRRGMYLM